jgi:hypothetical protein
MSHIIPKDVLAVTPRTSARADRAVTVISGRGSHPVETVTHDQAADAADAAVSVAEAHSPLAGTLARRVDEVIAVQIDAGCATPAERLRIASELSGFGASLWRFVQPEDCVWMAFMLLRLDAQFTGRWGAAEAWRSREDEAMADAKRAEQARLTAAGTAVTR